MGKLVNVMNELKALRGRTVRQFGQEITLESVVSDFTVDTLDILSALADFEIEEIEFLNIYDEDKDDEEWEMVSIDDMEEEEILDRLESLGYIDSNDYDCNNSYNWGANVSNHFDYKIYRNQLDGGVIAQLKVHRGYGDVRCNYTESVFLKFDSKYDFFEAIEEAAKVTSVNFDYEEYSVIVDPLQYEYIIQDDETFLDWVGAVLDKLPTE